MQAGAYQSGTWVVGVAKAGMEEGVDGIGGSCIVAPSGEALASRYRPLRLEFLRGLQARHVQLRHAPAAAGVRDDCGATRGVADGGWGRSGAVTSASRKLVLRITSMGDGGTVNLKCRTGCGYLQVFVQVVVVDALPGPLVAIRFRACACAAMRAQDQYCKD
ncbi:hypothetical protein UB46_19800 [Burkholderiaceae bacterium 16]|nr:hypothetical protein UB46_19800 [Burkholderiaceae bacterium 16]